MGAYSVVSDSFATLWSVAQQAPLSIGFSSKHTGMGCHAFLQGIYSTQGSKLQILYGNGETEKS